ncbi:MAG TPA: LTA synthase family protein [Acidisphaera sp.]|nr:LTA synthase family protein [Acidisphaera sp.]
MSQYARVLAGAALPLLAWVVLRRIAGTRRTGLVATALDLMPVGVMWAVAFAITARPLGAGVLVLGLLLGLALADRTKRAVLLEPVVFSDAAELVQVFTHPRLYLPFAGPALVYGGGALVAIGFGGVLLAEPSWPRILPVAGVEGLAAALAAGLWFPPLLGLASSCLARLGPSGDPTRDTAELGPLACLLTYSVIARRERPGRRAAVRPAPALARTQATGAALRPVVLLQVESFFDPRRVSPSLPPDLLAGWDRCCARSVSHGRLSVPCWGANTMRAEFTALTGLPDEALGFDRFNPYWAFARRPVDSLAWRLRAIGYRTVCVHPYSRRFYRRDVAMRCLGFDAFIGEEAFAGAERQRGYVSDRALARFVLDLLNADGRPVFVFAISMGNHGPWQDGPEAGLQDFLDGLRDSDGMFALMGDAPVLERRAAVLAAYGDNQPGLPGIFASPGLADTQTDYFVRDFGRVPPAAGTARDLAAYDLPGLLYDLAAQNAAESRRGLEPIGGGALMTSGGPVSAEPLYSLDDE